MSEIPFGSAELAAAYDGLSEPQFAHGTELLTLLEVGPGDRVLDIGCGTGRLAVAALGRVGPEGCVVGIDPAAPRIAIAREHADPRLDFRIGQAEDLSSFPDATFDVAYLNSVLNWVPDRKRAVREAYRVLKLGGRLGIATTVRDRPNQLWLLARRAWRAAQGVREHTGPTTEERPRERSGSGRAPTVDEIRELLAGSGFTPRSIELRTFTSVFCDAAQIVDFLQATTYGQFVPGAGAADYARFHAALKALLAREYPSAVTGDGIRLERYVLLAVADKLV